uniref:Uncharacterized protein n=1 Tax=Trichinella nativa TaxID=6335 RepID=A0A0V1KHI2_9BILA
MLPEDNQQPWQGGLIEHSHVVEIESQPPVSYLIQ